MTTPTEKPEYVQIYEAIKQRQAEYSVAHPGKYYLLSDEEMDDIESYHQIETLRRLADERKKAGKPPPPPPPVPKRSLVEMLLECDGFVDARVETRERRLLTRFEADLLLIVAGINANSNVIRLPTNPKN